MMDNMPDEQRRRILDEVTRYLRLPMLAPDEFTARQFAERQRPRISVKLARIWLNKEYDEGRLHRRWVLHGERRCYGYSLVEGTTPGRHLVDEDGADQEAPRP